VLVAILEDEESQDIESEVLKALSMIGGEGEKVLIRRLEKGSPRVRRRAAIALGFSGRAEARKALARAMLDRASEVRVAAIRALGKQGASQYLDVMLRFLNDPDPAMRRTVIEVTTNLSITRDGAEIMQDKLAPLLGDSSAAVRAAALSALREIGQLPEKMLEQIRQCLTDPDNTVASAACLLLAHHGDHSILHKLLQILSDQERDVSLRSQVATVLGILGDSEAVGILSWAVGDKAQPVRLAALRALMALEKHQASQVLETKTPSPAEKDNKADPRTPLEVVIAALEGKMVVSSPSELELEPAKASDDAEPLAGEGGQTTADSETPSPALSTLEAIAQDNAEAALLMDRDNPADVAELPEMSDKIQEYVDIAQENIELGERLFVQKQVDVAADVRHLSARILGESDHIETIRALIEVLNDADPVLRREAADSLGQIAGRSPETKGLVDAFSSLVTHLSMGDRDLRLSCVRTLGLLGKRAAIPALFACLQNEESSVRTQTIQSLTALIPADIGQRQQLDEKMTSDTVSMSMSMSTRAVIAQFVEMLHDMDFGVRKAAALSVAALGHKEALDSIIEAAFANAGAAARDMGRALRLLDVEQSGDKLLKMLDSVPDSSHRRFVIEMLEEIFRVDPI
jgi:HEAT repeat protein